MRQCICQICVCGRHRCEHSRRRRIPFAKDDEEGLLTTEHKERFKPFGFQPREKPVKPASEAKWKGDEPAVQLSTTKKDFIAFPIKKRSLIRPKESTVAKGKMADSDTTYQHDYGPKKITREKAKIPEPEGKDGTMPGTLPGKFQAITTYNKCYTPKPFDKTEKADTAKECTLTEFGKPFTGQTETALSYQPHPLEKREILLPYKGTLRPEGDFTDATTHQTDFTPKYIVPERPAKKKFGRWKPGEGKFESETTHKHDYRCPLQPEKAISYVPKSEMVKTEAPFEGKSHYKQDFQPYKVLQRMLPKWHPMYKPFKMSMQPFEGETTYKTDYEPPPEDLPQYEPIKPLKCSLTIPSGPMEKLTTFMRDYRPCDLVPTKSFKPEPKYEKPKEKFCGCTITRTDYTPKDHEKIQISKAKDNLKPGKGPMDDMTMTMKDFQWLALECPATYLKLFGKDALPNYVFEKTEHGHDIFKRLNGKKGSKKSFSIKHEKSKKAQKIKQK